jgi:Oligopeptide/dipeptide transporter, C-terminal region
MLAAFLLIYSAIAGRVERSWVSGPIVFTAIGFLEAIPGSPPDMTALPSGCSFAPRCRFAEPRCRDTVPPEIRARVRPRCALSSGRRQRNRPGCPQSRRLFAIAAPRTYEDALAIVQCTALAFYSRRRRNSVLAAGAQADVGSGDLVLAGIIGFSGVAAPMSNRDNRLGELDPAETPGG